MLERKQSYLPTKPVIQKKIKIQCLCDKSKLKFEINEIIMQDKKMNFLHRIITEITKILILELTKKPESERRKIKYMKII